MTQDERKVIELALEALEMIHDENMDYLTRNKLGGENNQCMVFARETITAIKEALAQPETPYKIGQRIAKTGGGISHLWSAVSQDDEIAEAERGFKEALAQPEQDQDEVDIRSRLYQRIHELETQLAQSEQEPVAWMYESVCGNDFSTCIDPPSYAKNIRPLYTTPPQRKKD